MSATTNDGGPAFPHFQFTETGKVEILPQGGMSLRDWFAGQALAGMASRAPVGSKFSDYAMQAYFFADAMIAEREDSE